MIHTCKDCEKRFPGCHSTCETYTLARIIHEEEREKVNQAKKEFSDYVSVKVKAVDYNRKKRRSK